VASPETFGYFVILFRPTNAFGLVKKLDFIGIPLLMLVCWEGINSHMRIENKRHIHLNENKKEYETFFILDFSWLLNSVNRISIFSVFASGDAALLGPSQRRVGACGDE
jgi:hypothetical protein